ncbi:MAG: DUF692 domain-containing protein [Proteobacteria bacterium]|nr:DUF692 domain-containing protein [Pseudomonadota bacterium]MDE3207557.1 DUF692 domain-containing protein [Pseudomonadota bacterium]
MPSAHRAMPIPVAAGIGLRSPHYRDIATLSPSIPWLEVHAENFFGDGGPDIAWLDQIRQCYPLSIHGVGLSLGTAGQLDMQHLKALNQVVSHFKPALVSEHLSFSRTSFAHANDLLPMPYTREAVETIATHIIETQTVLGQKILVENISSYLEFPESIMPEWAFIGEVVNAADCYLLLDVNNLYVNSINHGFDALTYLGGLPTSQVREIHLAGHTVTHHALIDTHDTQVCDAVWDLYTKSLKLTGNQPTLIEWDSNIPELSVLLSEAKKAQTCLEQNHAIIPC